MYLLKMTSRVSFKSPPFFLAKRKNFYVFFSVGNLSDPSLRFCKNTRRGWFRRNSADLFLGEFLILSSKKCKSKIILCFCNHFRVLILKSFWKHSFNLHFKPNINFCYLFFRFFKQFCNNTIFFFQITKNPFNFPEGGFFLPPKWNLNVFLLMETILPLFAEWCVNHSHMNDFNKL